MLCHQATPTYSVQCYAACREVVSYGRRRRVFLQKKIALRVRALQARGITLSSFQRCQWKANIPQGDQPVIVSEKWIPEVGNRGLRSSQNGGFFWEKRPLKGKFSQMFSKRPTDLAETRLFVQMS